MAAWHHHQKPKRRTRPGLDADNYLLRSGSFGVALGQTPNEQADKVSEESQASSSQSLQSSGLFVSSLR